MFKTVQALKKVFSSHDKEDALSAETSRATDENLKAAAKLKGVMTDVFDHNRCPLRVVRHP